MSDQNLSSELKCFSFYPASHPPFFVLTASSAAAIRNSTEICVRFLVLLQHFFTAIGSPK